MGTPTAHSTRRLIAEQVGLGTLVCTLLAISACQPFSEEPEGAAGATTDATAVQSDPAGKTDQPAPTPSPGTIPYNPSGVELADLGEPEFFGTVPEKYYAGHTKVMFLTFDDGPDPTYTPLILDVLEKHGAKATFLVLGANAEQHPELMAEIYRRGHAVGSHTWDHKNLAKLDATAVAAQMTQTDTALGARTTCMRPPYGATNKATRAQLTSMGKWVLHWDLGTGDWENRTAAQISDTLVHQATNGALTLMHDGGGRRDTTVAGVDDALTKLTADGWTFEVLPMCQLQPLAST